VRKTEANKTLSTKSNLSDLLLFMCNYVPSNLNCAVVLSFIPLVAGFDEADKKGSDVGFLSYQLLVVGTILCPFF
jgi:hypothetical protein